MLGDLAVYRVAVIIVIGKRIIDCRERQMGIVLEQLFRGQPMQQSGHDNRANRDPCAGKPWTAATDVAIADDMGMGDRGHNGSLADFLCPGNP